MRLIGVGLIVGFFFAGYLAEKSFAKRITSFQVQRHLKADRQ